MEILDWKKIVDDNSLTQEEFVRELFLAIAELGTKIIDEGSGVKEEDALIFNTEDSKGRIQVIIRRV